jgi:hypothetical protein
MYVFYFREVTPPSVDYAPVSERRYRLIALKGRMTPENPKLGHIYTYRGILELVNSGFKVVVEPSVEKKIPMDLGFVPQGTTDLPTMRYAKGYHGPNHGDTITYQWDSVTGKLSKYVNGKLSSPFLEYRPATKAELKAAPGMSEQATVLLPVTEPQSTIESSADYFDSTMADQGCNGAPSSMEPSAPDPAEKIGSYNEYKLRSWKPEDGVIMGGNFGEPGVKVEVEPTEVTGNGHAPEGTMLTPVKEVWQRQPEIPAQDFVLPPRPTSEERSQAAKEIRLARRLATGTDPDYEGIYIVRPRKQPTVTVMKAPLTFWQRVWKSFVE